MAKLKVFFSWQSDIPQRKELIKLALQKSGDIEIDESTRNTAGACQIAEVILKKISEADVFLCDLSIINASDPGSNRKTPNPNVMLETGYAVAVLGWDRMILFYPEEDKTALSHLPFDLGHRRVLHIPIDKLNQSQVNKDFNSCIKAIIKQNPDKPYLHLGSKEAFQKFNKDVESLKKKVIPYLCFQVWEPFFLVAGRRVREAGSIRADPRTWW